MPNWYVEQRASGLLAASNRARTGFTAKHRETVSLSIEKGELDGDGSYAVSGTYVYSDDEENEQCRNPE